MRLLQRIVRANLQSRTIAGTTAAHRETSYNAFVKLQENFEKLKQQETMDTKLKGTEIFRAEIIEIMDVFV